MRESDNGKRLAPGSKRAGVLLTLLERGERGLNCFEAVTLCHDYVLRSTISDLRREHDLRFRRHWEQIRGHGGAKVECVRYSLTAEDAITARELLGLASHSAPAPRTAKNALLQAELAI